MLNERAELEKTFSKMLKSWSKKWSDYVAKCMRKRKILFIILFLSFFNFLILKHLNLVQ